MDIEKAKKLKNGQPVHIYIDNKNHNELTDTYGKVVGDYSDAKTQTNIHGTEFIYVTVHVKSLLRTSVYPSHFLS